MESRFELYKPTVIYTDGKNGAILRDGGQWQPFTYFNDGEMDFSELLFASPEYGLEAARAIFT